MKKSFRMSVILATAFAVCLMMVTFLIPATKANAAVSGSCGEGVTWSYDGNTLTISGSGYMKDYPVYDTPVSDQCMPWYFYKGLIKNLVVEEGVKSIGDCAFWGCNAITNIDLPGSMEWVGFAAFADCSSIENATIRSGRIGESAFIRCTNLKQVTVGSGVTAFGISCFENCKNLTRVNISDVAAWCNIYFGGYLANPTSACVAHGQKSHLYLNGNLVTTLDIPSGVTTIGDYAFMDCEDIVTLNVPDSVTKIGDYAFYECRGMTTANLTNNITYIGASAFDSDCKLTSVAIPTSIQYIGSYGFAYTPLNAITVHQGIIADNAFLQCGTMYEVNLGAKVKSIGKNAFSECDCLNPAVSAWAKVNYMGSKEQWECVEIASGNEKITNIVNCTGTGNASTPGKGYYGKTVTFGKFEQDANGANGKEDIEWTVLKVENGQALLISKYVMKFNRYAPNIQATNYPWNGSAICSWLNASFSKEAFDEAQMSKIITKELAGDSNSKFGNSTATEAGTPVFILSNSEVEKYFLDEADAKTSCTTWAIEDYKASYGAGADSALKNPTLGTTYYWTRSTGEYYYDKCYVHYTGSVRKDGMAVANTITGVRPAIWVSEDVVTSQVQPEGGKGTPTDSTKVKAFVERMYSNVLNREGDAAGVEDWTNKLVNGERTGSEVAFGFFLSKEMEERNLSDEAFVKICYKTILGREADEGGLAGWAEDLKNGLSRTYIVAGFTNSTEFDNICKEYGITRGELSSTENRDKNKGITAYVARCYTKALGREFDVNGLNDWAGQILGASNQKAKAEEVASNGFFHSQEFNNKNTSNDEYVEILYRTFLGREYDEAGKADWVGKLKSGTSRDDVMYGFSRSAEFANIMAEYGIK